MVKVKLFKKRGCTYEFEEYVANVLKNSSYFDVIGTCCRIAEINKKIVWAAYVYQNNYYDDVEYAEELVYGIGNKVVLGVVIDVRSVDPSSCGIVGYYNIYIPEPDEIDEYSDITKEEYEKLIEIIIDHLKKYNPLEMPCKGSYEKFREYEGDGYFECCEEIDKVDCDKLLNSILDSLKHLLKQYKNKE